MIRLASLKLTALVILIQNGFKKILKYHNDCLFDLGFKFSCHLAVLLRGELCKKNDKNVLICLALLQLRTLVTPNQNGFKLFLNDNYFCEFIACLFVCLIRIFDSLAVVHIHVKVHKLLKLSES